MSLRDGIFRATQIDWRSAAYDWPFPRVDAARIDANWAMRRRATPAIYNGRMLLMRDLALVGDRFACTCFETSYKAFLAWRDGGFPQGDVVNCFGMAALKSADGAFMLGAMNPTTASGGKLYFPAGTPEPADIGPDGTVDLIGGIMRELAEETGLGPDDVEAESGWTIVVAGARVACMRLLRASASAAELRDRLVRFNAGQADPELVDLVPIRSPADYDRARMPDFMVSYLDWALAAT